MLANRLLLGQARGVIAPYYWPLLDGPGPYADIGNAAAGRDMTAIGTVTDDSAFPGISLVGNGAVAVADTDSWVNNIVAGENKKFSIKLKFNLNALGTFAIAGKVASASNQRQFQVVTRPDGAVDFIWYGALNAASFRVVRAVSAIFAGVTHVLDLIYDGTVFTNNGLDRVSLYIDGVQKTLSLPATQGGLPAIVAGPARLSVGAGVSSSGAIESPANGKFSTFALYDDLMPFSQIGVS